MLPSASFQNTQKIGHQMSETNWAQFGKKTKKKINERKIPEFEPISDYIGSLYVSCVFLYRITAVLSNT